MNRALTVLAMLVAVALLCQWAPEAREITVDDYATDQFGNYLYNWAVYYYEIAGVETTLIDQDTTDSYGVYEITIDHTGNYLVYAFPLRDDSTDTLLSRREYMRTQTLVAVNGDTAFFRFALADSGFLGDLSGSIANADSAGVAAYSYTASVCTTWTGEADGQVAWADSSDTANYADQADHALTADSSDTDFRVNGELSIDGGPIVGGDLSDTYASGTYSFAYGDRDTATGDYSVALGGLWNTVTGIGGAALGGGLHTVDGNYAVIVGGSSDTTGAESAVIAGGTHCRSDAANTFNSGYGNKILGASSRSAIIGGEYGEIDGGIYSAIIGGDGNSVTGDAAVVIAGEDCHASGDGSVTLAGKSNQTSQQYSCIAGGNNNTLVGGAGSRGFMTGYANLDSGSYNATFGKENVIYEAANINSVFGEDHLVRGTRGFVAGWMCTTATDGGANIVVGVNNNVGAVDASIFGSNSDALWHNSYIFGRNCGADTVHAYIIGKGLDAQYNHRLRNPYMNSMVIGFEDTLATMFINGRLEKDYGAHNHSVGIGTLLPQERLHVVGNVQIDSNLIVSSTVKADQFIGDATHADSADIWVGADAKADTSKYLQRWTWSAPWPATTALTASYEFGGPTTPVYTPPDTVSINYAALTAYRGGSGAGFDWEFYIIGYGGTDTLWHINLPNGTPGYTDTFFVDPLDIYPGEGFYYGLIKNSGTASEKIWLSLGGYFTNPEQ